MERILSLTFAGAVGIVGSAYTVHKMWSVVKTNYIDHPQLVAACEQLRGDIKELIRRKKKEFQFLMFGITGHGKSSLCCGLMSSLNGEDYVSNHFQPGAAASENYTKGFRRGKLADRLWVIDMEGIFESSKQTDEMIQKAIARNTKQNPEDLEFPETPGEEEQNFLSCVVYVMKPNTELNKELRNKFRVIEDCAARGGISRCLVVTHIEEIDSQFEDPRNLVNIEKSAKIRACRKKMSDETGVPEAYITFVRNYWNQSQTDVYTNHILLKLLHRLMLSD